MTKALAILPVFVYNIVVMKKLEIAKILKPQGIKGDVKIALFARDINLQDLPLFVDGKECKVQKFYPVGDGYAIKLDIISSRNDAENFRGKLIEVDKDQIKIEKGKYLVDDLIGKLAVLDSGKQIGKIKSVSNFGSADVIAISGEKEILCSHKQGLIERVEAEKVVFNDKIFEEVAVYED